MTEEELAKMSVRLLNCQAQAEGRQTFACSADMVSVIYNVCTVNTLFNPQQDCSSVYKTNGCSHVECVSHYQ